MANVAPLLCRVLFFVSFFSAGFLFLCFSFSQLPLRGCETPLRGCETRLCFSFSQLPLRGCEKPTIDAGRHCSEHEVFPRRAPNRGGMSIFRVPCPMRVSCVMRRMSVVSFGLIRGRVEKVLFVPVWACYLVLACWAKPHSFPNGLQRPRINVLHQAVASGFRGRRSVLWKIKKAVATADNARISLGGAVEATATKVDKDNRGALSGANAAAVEDASATEQAKVRHFRTRSKTRHEGRTRTPEEAPQGSLITLASSAVSGARSSIDRPITMLRANTPHYYRRRQRWRSNH